MTDILRQAAESRRGFLKASGLVSLATLAGSGLTTASAEETAPAKADPKIAADIAKLKRVKQVLVDPPFLPEHEQTAPAEPRVIEVTLPIVEKKIQIDEEGTEIWALDLQRHRPWPDDRGA